MSSFCTFLLCCALLLTSCTAPAKSEVGRDFRPSPGAPSVAVTPENELAGRLMESTELCKQLADIKQFPGRDPSERQDPVYASIMAQGKSMMPCLVEEITNETPMHDPRQAPVWQHYKVGDTAVFLLARISENSDVLKEMLPPAYREEWKTNGVYAYFNYVSDSRNRKELQKWWRNWTKKNVKSK